MDISTLTNLIDAFRAETRTNSITPDTLGQLLQKIVNLLENAAEATAVQQLEDWEGSLTGLGSVLTRIALGADDRNNIILNIGSINTTTGMGQSTIFTLRQATTERAGIMRAQQVTDLNSVRNKMQHLATLHMEVSASPSAVQLALKESNGDVFNSAQALSVSLPKASATQAGILSAEDYQRLGNGSGGGTGTGTKPFYHIECDTRKGKLIVKYPAAVISAGYKPYLLRYSRKKPRYRDVEDKTTRWYGPTMRGWHLFYNEKKIKVSSTGEVQIGHNVGTDKYPVWEYSTDNRWLFGEIRRSYKGNPPNRVLEGYKVGFGCRTHLIKTNHRFRFGIVFGPALPSGGSPYLDFSKCVTNIAEFYVNLHKTDRPEYDGEYFAVSYSI
jgi:hypothetical protein